MPTILEDVKANIGVTGSAFDAEILSQINNTLITLHDLGLTVFENIEVLVGTNWPTDVTSPMRLIHAYKSYIYINVKIRFDPTSSATKLDTRKDERSELEQRIMTTVSEINAA